MLIANKYFADIRDILLGELTVRYEQDRQSREVAEEITSTSSVSIHVRRGDLVSNPFANRVFGTCSPEYYMKCIDFIGSKITDPHFFVFSDDSSWSSENLNLQYPTTFVNHNDANRDYEDLRLMSSCKHHILANSSFSWWAAWLNTNPDKTVLAPARWFRDEGRNTPDRLPDSWIKI